MKKKFFALMMAMVMVLSLAACGGSDEADSNSGDSAGGESSGSSAFKVGVIGPLTGGAAIYGTCVANSAQIAVDEINALGGDIQFELMTEDDVNDAETSVNAYNALMDDGMQILVGTVTTQPALSVVPLSYEDRVFTLTPSASGDDVISIIYKNDDQYSIGIRDNFKAEADSRGMDIVYEGTFTEASQTDFNVQLAGAQSAGADLLFLPIYYTPASVILTQANAMGYAPTFFGVDGMDGILTAENFDASLAEGVYLLTPFSADSEDEMTQNFVAEYQDRFGEIPNQFGADAYDAIYTLYQAIQAAGATADMSNEEICDALIEVMPTLAVTGLTSAGSEMTWDENGAVSKDPTAVIIENGTYVTP